MVSTGRQIVTPAVSRIRIPLTFYGKTPASTSHSGGGFTAALVLRWHVPRLASASSVFSTAHPTSVSPSPSTARPARGDTATFRRTSCGGDAAAPGVRSPVKVTVDEDRCRGHGMCLTLCPEVFEMTDDGYAVADSSAVPTEYEDAAQEAIANCPERAIVEAMTESVVRRPRRSSNNGVLSALN